MSLTLFSETGQNFGVNVYHGKTWATTNFWLAANKHGPTYNFIQYSVDEVQWYMNALPTGLLCWETVSRLLGGVCYLVVAVWFACSMVFFALKRTNC